MDNNDSDTQHSQHSKQDEDLRLLSSLINTQLNNPDSPMSRITKIAGKVHCLSCLLKQP